MEKLRWMTCEKIYDVRVGLMRANEFQWAAFAPAIIGLVGVFVGAAITAGANYLLVIRKERLEEAKEKRFLASELKTAARVVAMDLFVAQAAASVIVDQKMCLAIDRDPLDGWQKYKGVLARELPEEDWSAILPGVNAVEHVYRLTLSIGTEKNVDEALVETVSSLWGSIKTATVLSSYYG